MGIPAAFRWLSSKYPKIISPVIEQKPQKMDDGTVIPVDITGPNPNGEEFDNLYLDMNGIVHPCSHPEDRPPPADEEEMMLEIFKYTDRVVNMVRPRKLLMIAVDGVAPRAKMNQQRSRRFRSAQEAKEKEEDKEELLKLLKQQNGGTLPEESLEAVTKKAFDSNSITPGTPFMDILAASLRYWCAYKLNTDPGWAKMKIIISDASVPGEGEHKIMDFVRAQRASPNHDPNTRHVIYGLDADLIMLSLATHEPHFRVLREDVFFQDGKARLCKLCGQKGHDARECKGEAKKKDGEHDEKDSEHTQKPFIWLHVAVLREYLAVELDVPSLPFRWDLERAIDDWIFLCCFVGNDFLPHLPALEIRENGINTLTALWKDNLPIMGGYITKDGHVDLDRAQVIMTGLAKQEDGIFRRRKQQEDRREENNKRRRLQQEQGKSRNDTRNGPRTVGGDSVFAEGTAGLNLRPIATFEVPKTITHDMVVNRGAVADANVANKSAASVLKSRMQNRAAQPASNSDETPAPAETTAEVSEMQASALGKRKADLIEDDATSTQQSSGTDTPKTTDEGPVDTVRMWEEGYADRYYEQKFHVDPKDIEFRHGVARAYVEGLAWVLLYYFQGCPSWEWYYPYHYAPFAADFVDLGKLELRFEKGRISKPFEQLMSVLPAASRHAIPEVFHDLMLNDDSEIIDFYPEEFDLDLNGKKFAWQGVALLPFIDMKRLLSAIEKRYPLLSPADQIRNGVGKIVMLLSDADTALYDEITSNFYSKRQGSLKYKLDPLTSGGVAGNVEKIGDYIPHGSLAYPLERKALPDIEYDRSVSVNFELLPTSHGHKSMLLRGVKLSEPLLNRGDKEALLNHGSRSGRNFNGNNGYNNGRPRHDGGGRYQSGNQGQGGQYNRQGGRPPPYSLGGSNGRGSYQGPPPSWTPPAPGQAGFGSGRPPPPPPAAHMSGGRYNDGGYGGGGYNNGGYNGGGHNGGGYNGGGYNGGGYNGGGYHSSGHNGRNDGYQNRYSIPPPPGAYNQQSYRPPPGYGGQGHRQGDNRDNRSGGYHNSRGGYRG
ncbi:5'-3' exoribonuclease 2 [Sporothrix eucalyptigena]|uniref:5'-3' exoribonuclease n=1 Tax=Sporothrix eucalyptigena TaxID=1812306 RepID=A0ABP0BCZ8_9PEZI